MYPDIVHGWAIPERHLAEGAFLWARLENIVRSSRHTLEDAVEQEQRLRAHIDGLLIGGHAVATRLLKPALEEEDAPLVATAATVLLLQEAQVAVVLGLLREGTEFQHQSLRKALERCEREDLEARLAVLPASLPDSARAAVLEVQALRGWDAGAALLPALKSESPEVTAAALRAARATPTRVEPRMIHTLLDSPSLEVRDAALALGVALGSRSALRRCQQLVAQQAPGSRRAMEWLALSGEPSDLEALLALTRIPALRCDAVWALGFSGRVSVAEAALAWMRDEDLRFARLASEAFSAITGLELEGVYRRELAEEEADIPLEAEDLDADLTPSPEEDLPAADADRVAAWWAEARKRFDAQGRYLRGKPFSAPVLQEALRQEPMRRRHVLAQEALVRSRGTQRLEARTPALQQQLALARPWTFREADVRAPLKHFLGQE
ncbi:TIGR02270 family protein [Comamonas sp. JC664]|uniref:TIGR02270 family protein n=1 Tax=Comamonas sp. JC664 TaxID=2801917 RepID=UPI00174A5EBC|nr:TIGR02270 family protein [Comamonas sp. JC664]MBL0698713.1 TIGR02270 family protein [Comamonas sp. JC664]GHG78615.1 hypothetical protein GCM10012319_29410 [Comamonas sp. KCTC 72670]